MNANANEKVIWSLLDSLRGGLEILGAFEVSLQLLAWAKLSRAKMIPVELCLTEKARTISAEELWLLFTQLSELKTLGQNRAAFQSFLAIRREVAERAISPAIDIAHEFSQSGMLDRFEVPESSYYNLGRAVGLLLVPSEVSDLMLALAGNVSKKQVYCPYDTLCLLAYKADKKEADVYVESPTASPIPWLINIFSETDIDMCIGDPVRQPSYSENDGKLKQFDITLAFPPIGTKYSREVIEQDWFERFPDHTLSGSVLQIRHMIAQTKDKAVIAVPNSILFGRGAEHALRQDLIKRGMIEAVISMPPAILPFTAVQFSIVILNPYRARDTIRFVDGSSDRFFERDGKNRSRLINWKELLETFHHSTDEAIALNVPIKDVLKNDAHLEVSRYLLPPEQKKAEQLLKASDIRLLKELVRFVRPSTKIQGEGDLEAFEVAVIDFPEFGYLSTPQRTITISEAALTPKEADTFLKPGDVVIATKGSVGKLAIVPDQVPPPGEGGWLVNQSCLILRTSRQIDPKVLFMYLRSDLGQTLLKGIVSGATIPLIQLQALQNLQVIVPSMEEARSISNTFDMQLELQRKIEQMRQEQHKLSKVHWGIDGIDIANLNEL